MAQINKICPFLLLVVCLLINYSESYGHLNYNNNYGQPQITEEELAAYMNQQRRPLSAFRQHSEDLSRLNENELETLLLLLEKVKGANNEGTGQGSNSAYAGGRYPSAGAAAATFGRFAEEPVELESSLRPTFYLDHKNKRTGNIPIQKRGPAFNWDEYFGLDKKKRSPAPTLTGQHHQSQSPLLHSAGAKLAAKPKPLPPAAVSHSHTAAETTELPSTAKPAAAEKSLEEAKAKKAKEEQEKLHHFFEDMAFATNIRRRKRDAGPAHAIAIAKNEEQAINKKTAKPVVQEDAPVPPSTGSTPTTAETLPKPEPMSNATDPKNSTVSVANGPSKQTMNTNGTSASSSLTPAPAVTEHQPVNNNAAPNAAVGNSSEPNVIVATQIKLPNFTITASNGNNGEEMSRGDLEKLKARLIKQISSAYTLDQLRQVFQEINF